MKKVIQVSIAAVLMIGAISCGQDEAKKAESEPTQNTEQVEVPKEKMKELRMNDQGRKWQVNAEMKEYLSNSKRVVERYLEENSSDYLALAKKIEGQNKKMIMVCTMKGDSHDALHLWLEPNMALVEKLSQTTDKEMADEIVLELKDSYAVLDKYFDYS